jgi:uncharacterized protein
MLESGNVLSEIFVNPKPIIGMIHLRPLPGSPLYHPEKMSMDGIIETAVEEASKLAEAGVDGLQVENIWDFPYLKGEEVGHETTAALAVTTAKVREATSIPVGINCHLNGGEQALAAAVASGAQWIRVFAWVNAYVSHAGILEGIGARLARYRAMLRAESIKCFSDVNVKHGSHFIVSDRSISEQAHDAESEGAEVLIATGFETGKAPTPDKVREFVESVTVPVLIGSGTTVENVAALLAHADGAIVGSYFKKDGNWKMPIDQEKARRFMQAVVTLRGEL